MKKEREDVQQREVGTYRKSFYRIITVSDNGQVALPKEAREDLDIKPGDKLLVIPRKDRKGIVLIKAEIMDEFFKSFQEEGG
jgi:AbrB family looped-hinge helix DNA binding protein